MNGGLTPDATRVLHTHGSLDPWHALGLQSDLNPDVPVIIIDGLLHTYKIFIVCLCCFMFIHFIFLIYSDKNYIFICMKRYALFLIFKIFRRVSLPWYWNSIILRFTSIEGRSLTNWAGHRWLGSTSYG
jgi:hypothetical protein